MDFARCMSSSLVIIFVLGTAAQLNGPNRAQTISNIFQIPIQTLTAVSNVVQNTRPIGDALQNRIMRLQQFQDSFAPSSNFGQNSQGASVFTSFGQGGNFVNNNPSFSQRVGFSGSRQYPSRASRIAGLYQAADGSGFRI